MRTKLTIFALMMAIFTAAGALAQPCVGFSSDPNDFVDLAPIDLLPTQTWDDPQPIVRGGVEYTGGSLLIGTECPGAWGDLALCDFSGPVTGVPAGGMELRRYAVDFWADVWINPFQMEIELSSGAIETFTATVSGGFVGYCAPGGETIVRVQMVGHDGVATAIYHGQDSPVAGEIMAWGAAKAQYR